MLSIFSADALAAPTVVTALMAKGSVGALMRIYQTRRFLSPLVRGSCIGSGYWDMIVLESKVAAVRWDRVELKLGLVMGRVLCLMRGRGTYEDAVEPRHGECALIYAVGFARTREYILGP